ncbi:TPA: hypothetical protein ACNICG_003477 [Acinetobacter baumannii]
MHSHLDTVLKQQSFSRHLIRGDYGSAFLITGLEWLPDSLNMPEDEIIKQTDEKFMASLNQFCEENKTVFESVSDDAKNEFLIFVHRYIASNRLREAICKIIAKKAALAIQLPFVVIDTKDMKPSDKQALLDSMKKDKTAILPNDLKVEFKNLGEQHDSSN